MSDLDDHALLRRAAEGDGRAAGVLVERLGPRLLASVARLLGGDRAEAEDVVQEAFLRLWRKGADWDAGGAAAPGTWLHRVAANLALDRRRRAGARWDELDDAHADDAPGAEARLMAGERVEALEAALAALPERQRVAVVLRHVEGYANPEIAAMMDVGVEAVESLTSRGRRRLAALLGPRKEELGHG
nr:sigma-70 family RNA polymerase sigma factor [Jannaschia sp. Os4]